MVGIALSREGDEWVGRGITNGGDIVLRLRETGTRSGVTASVHGSVAGTGISALGAGGEPALAVSLDGVALSGTVFVLNGVASGTLVGPVVFLEHSRDPMRCTTATWRISE